MKPLLSLLFCAAALAASAQTNVTFQDCHAGDLVKVKSDHPVLELGKARLLEIGSNTVTVCTAEDRFVLDKTNVVLLPLEAPTAATPVVPQETAPPPSAAPSQPSDGLTTLANSVSNSDPVHSLAAVQEMVLGTYKNDPNSAKANQYYHETMQGVLTGQITQDELVKRAKEVLKQCDEYKEERQKDPQYEKPIEALRDFVRRSEAGEKFDFKTNVQ